MKLIKAKIVVIGGGPAAAAFCTRLAEKRHEATVIVDGSLTPGLHYDRIAKIDPAPDIWKLSNTEKSVNVNLCQHQNFNHVSIRGFGGLSSRWGGGMAKLSHLDLNIDCSIAHEIHSYYDFAHNMTGTNNNLGDALSGYLGAFSSPHFDGEKLDHVTRFKYATKTVVFGKSVQAIWRSARPETAQKACNLCGHCSIFCGRGSFYNAQQSFHNLNNFHQIFENTKVLDVSNRDAGFKIHAVSEGKDITLNADIVVMAAGPVNTYRILKKTLLAKMDNPVPILNTPVIRGLAFSPFNRVKNNTTVANTTASIEFSLHEKALVSFVNGAEIPISDWLSFLPFKNKIVASAISVLRKYFIAYMIFFNSDYSQNTLEIKAGNIRIAGRNKSEFTNSSKRALFELNKFLLKNSFVNVPFLRVALTPGRDIHYGGTLPMNSETQPATNSSCELVGHRNIFIIDGSWMPRMSEKFHTLTLMANAARVADKLASRVPNR